MAQRGGNSASAWVFLAVLAVGAVGLWGWFSTRPSAPLEPPETIVAPSDAWSVHRREAPTSAPPSVAQPPLAALAKAPASSRFAQLNNEAVAALEQGELEHAVALFDQCVEGDPAEPVFRRNLAEALTRWAVRDHESVRPCPACVERLERACSLAPDREDLPRLLERWRRELETEGEFHRVSSVHFELAYEVWRGKLLDETANVLDALEHDYVELAAIFGVRPAENGRARIPLSLYRPAEFSNITGLAEWAGAAYDGVIRAPVSDDEALDDAFDELLRHELIHAFVRELGGRTVPGWLNEGLAQLFQGDPRVELARARTALRGAELIDLARLAGALTSLADRQQVSLAYAQSLAFCAWLEQQYGRPVLVAMVEGCAAGRSAEATFRQWSSVELGEAFGHFADSLR